MTGVSDDCTDRVLMLGETWSPDRPGGLNRYVAGLVAALDARNMPVEAVVIGPVSEPPPGLWVAADVERPLLRRVWAYWRTALAAGRSATVVDAHFALYAAGPVLLSRLHRLPLVVHFHGPWADEGLANHGWRLISAIKHLLERCVYQKSEVVVTLSSAFRQVAVERYGVSPWRVEVIAPAVDLGLFRPGSRLEARDELGLPADAEVVGCVRRLVPRMGIDGLLEAWAQIPVRGARQRLLVIGGEGPARSALEHRAAELGVAATTRFVGQLTDGELLALYRASDVCVIPSATLEGFGLVALEALACGTPVVVTNVGGLPESVTGLAPDLVVPGGDADALARRLADGLDRRIPFPVPAACRRQAETFSPDELADRHIGVYSRAAGRASVVGLRVVYVDHCARLSGGEVALLRLLASLDGVHAHVILGEDGPLVEHLHRLGVSVEVLPMAEGIRDLRRDAVRPGALPARSAVQAARYTAQLTRRLRRLRPDLVHTNSLKAALCGTLAARTAGIPVVWHARDRVAPDYLPRAAVRLVQLAARVLPAAVIANSTATLVTLEAGRRTLQTVVPDPFRRRRPVPLRRSRPVRVGIIGRLAPWKGQDLFLQAFARAFPTGPESAVVVGAALFGEEAYGRGLRDLAARLDLHGRVEFPGFRDDVEAAMDELDILVHASVIPEPFGQVVVEGMAAGLPVLAANAGGPAEIIRDEVDGLLYRAGDVDALARALQRLAADAALRERLGRAAVVRAEEFTPEAVAPAVQEVYRRVLGDG